MNRILLIGIATLFFFGLGGVLIVKYVQEKDLMKVLLSGQSIPIQLITGVLYGLFSSGLAWFIITRSFFEKERNYYQGIFENWDLNLLNILFISLCAGIGEEIFFRAGLQPILGIWLTSFIFVALHGYLNPFNWRKSIYGIIMFFIMGGIGYLFEYSGLITVMTAHTVFDIVLFVNMKKSS